MGDCNSPKPYKQRFKGVENFLRRIAFNLGNTPSQTEVKIISCIPIDVTDLQQKIVNLEKQLYEAEQQTQAVEVKVEAQPSENDQDKKKDTNGHVKQDKKGKQGTSTVVNTAFVRQSSAIFYNSKKPTGNIRMKQVSGYCEDCSTRPKKSNVSFVFPGLSAPIEQACGSLENHNNERDDNFKRNISNHAYKSIFRRRKKKKVIGTKSKIKTQFIYYAQESPKNPFHLQDNMSLSNQYINQSNQLSQSYLNSVLRRQYDPKIILEEFSDTSHFSKPICRDVEDKLNHSYLYESDVSSGSRGKFQNLDTFITNHLNFDILHENTFQQNYPDKIYYDSNFYDVVPVKDNGNKFTKSDVLKKGHKRHSDIKCLADKRRNKCRYHPFVVKYHKEIPTKTQSHKRDIVKLRSKHERINKREKHNSFEYSKSCCIECSNIYKKTHNTPKIKLRKHESAKKILFKDEKVETDTNTTLKANNQSTQSRLLPLEENKTESTLNQIKFILQSVLQEVKTNSNVNTVPEIAKKDAIIQKGSSQNNIDNYTLFNASDNSCNANLYLPSCSRQMSQGQYYYPGMPYQQTKCLQNYPVFIHPATRKPMCSCYYRHSLHKPTHNKQATTTATNTEKNIRKSSSNETEKLIKEIYKSMALNMDYPTKENSISDYDDLKSTRVNSIHGSINEKKGNKVDASTKRDTEIEAILSPPISNTNERNFVYTATRTQSRNKRHASELALGYAAGRNINANEEKANGVGKQSNDTIDEVDDEPDDSSDETETEETMVLSEDKQHKTEKRSFIQRMFNTVKLFKKRKDAQNQRNDSEVGITENSDSDEYHTISSTRTDKATKKKISPNTRKYFVKDRTEIDQKGYRRRSPYLEQEYRRQWNENLMFYDQHERYSSERPFSKPSTLQPSPRPIYWRNYEARSALVEHNLHNINGRIEKGVSSPTCMDEKDACIMEKDKKSKLAWIKNHKLGIHCGEQWKKFILEN